MNKDLGDFWSIDIDSDYTIASPGTASTITIDSNSYQWNVPDPAMTFQDTSTRFDCDVTISDSHDLIVGDRSLKDFMAKVEEKLNILHPNPDLEDRWNELAELGKQYRKLEAEILEKEKMWKILKDE